MRAADRSLRSARGRLRGTRAPGSRSPTAHSRPGFGPGDHSLTNWSQGAERGTERTCVQAVNAFGTPRPGPAAFVARVRPRPLALVARRSSRAPAQPRGDVDKGRAGPRRQAVDAAIGVGVPIAATVIFRILRATPPSLAAVGVHSPDYPGWVITEIAAFGAFGIAWLAATFAIVERRRPF